MTKVEAKAPKKAAKTKNQSKKSAELKKNFRFFKDVYYELKKVTWPTRKELKINTITVLVVTLLASILIGLLDWGMGSLYKLVLK